MDKNVILIEKKPSVEIPSLEDLKGNCQWFRCKNHRVEVKVLTVLKLRYFFIPLVFILLCLWWYSASYTKELTLQASTQMDFEVGKTELILKARFIELPFGLMYIDAGMNFNGNDYIASHKIMSPDHVAEPWLLYEIPFEDVVKEDILLNSTIRISGKSFREPKQVQLLFTKIDHGVLRSSVFECDVEEWRIE